GSSSGKTRIVEPTHGRLLFRRTNGPDNGPKRRADHGSALQVGSTKRHGPGGSAGPAESPFPGIAYWRLVPETAATWVTTCPSTTGSRSPAGRSGRRTVASWPS